MPCRRGATLLETLVACAVLALLTGLVVLVQISSQSFSRRSDLGSEVYRSAMLAAERLRGEFRGAYVESIADPTRDSITYWLPRVDNGVMQVLPTGEPDWLPGDPAEPDRAVIALRPNGWLERDFQGRSRRLAELGPAGKVTFELETGSRVLTCRVESRRAHPNDPRMTAEYDIRVRFFLSNQS